MGKMLGLMTTSKATPEAARNRIGTKLGTYHYSAPPIRGDPAHHCLELAAPVVRAGSSSRLQAEVRAMVGDVQSSLAASVTTRVAALSQLR